MTGFLASLGFNDITGELAFAGTPTAQPLV
jgi:hypothetical protein